MGELWAPRLGQANLVMLPGRNSRRPATSFDVLAELRMADCNLMRVKDQDTFAAQRVSVARAVLFFAHSVGKATLDGTGSPAYLLGKQPFSVGPIRAAEPVCRIAPAADKNWSSNG